MILHRLAAKHDLGHIDTVLCSAHLGNGTQMRLVRQCHVRQQHVEVAFADWDIAGLAGDKATVMQRRQQVSQFHQVFKRRDVAVTPTPLKVTYKRCSVDWSKNLVFAADRD